MNYEILEVSWIAGGLFFGIGQALVVGLMSFVPKDKDDFIEYMILLEPNMKWIFLFSWASLLLPICFTWSYCATKCTPSWFILSGLVTLLSIVVCFMIYRYLRVWLAQMRALPLLEENG